MGVSRCGDFASHAFNLGGLTMEKDHASEVATDTSKADKNRRAALAKLGLAVGTVYLAPTILRIDRSAHAMGPSCVKNPKFCV
jgi:hypothetical protein